MQQWRKSFRFKIPKEKSLFRFKSGHDLVKWRLGSDADFGGSSCGNWALTEAGTGLFWGSIGKTNDLNYAIIKSNEPVWSIFHKSTFDASDYTYIQVRAKIPRGTLTGWKLNIKTEAFYASNVFSHPMEFTKYDEFEILEFKFRHFRLPDSYKGKGYNMDMDTSRIKSFGFSVGHGDASGDFSLEIDWIQLRNK